MPEIQGADPEKYPHAYLITAARFLGYHFNPISFWYLYDAHRDLAAMILEVNNTFDERRMYFLTPQEDSVQKQVSDDAIDGPSASETRPSDSPESASASKFKQSWPKDLHVSPFNSRKGSYSLLASDPWRPRQHDIDRVDNTINLLSSKGHPKLVARLFTDGAPIDPMSMSLVAKTTFLLRWWWVGFVTFPRIVKEAALLFFRRKLHVWYRPEPLKENMGRRADSTERRLEVAFRHYLRHLVGQSTANLAVKYIPGGIDAEMELMRSPASLKQPKRSDELEFKVLTPAFYSRFVHYAHDFEAVFDEFRDNCTIWLSKPELLPKLVLKKPLPPLKASNIWDFTCFKVIQRLRQRPERIERPLTSSMPATPPQKGVDIRGFRISSMDGFVLAQPDQDLKRAYRADVARLFLAERVSLGSIRLLELEHLVIRVGMAWLISHPLSTGIMAILRA